MPTVRPHLARGGPAPCPHKLPRDSVGARIDKPPGPGSIQVSAETRIAAQVRPASGKATAAARALQTLGFRVLAVDESISVDAPEALWRSVFGVAFAERTRPGPGDTAGRPESFRAARPATLAIPETLAGLVEDVDFVEPPELY